MTITLAASPVFRSGVSTRVLEVTIATLGIGAHRRQGLDGILGIVLPTMKGGTLCLRSWIGVVDVRLWLVGFVEARKSEW